MGIDAVVLIEIPDGLDRRKLTLETAVRFHRQNFYVDRDRGERMFSDRPDGRVEVEVAWRYYSREYGRGPALSIIGLCEWFRHKGCRVWYGSDMADEPDEWTDETRDQMWQDFLEVGENWYGDPGGPECDFCEVTTFLVGGGPGGSLYRCRVCGWSNKEKVMARG